MKRDPLQEERESLEQQAALAKARLLAAIEALDQRRRDALSPAAHIQRHPYAAVVASGGVVLVLGSAVALGVYAARRREERLPQERWAALVRMWKHPERAGKAARGSLVSEIGRKLLLGLAGVAVMEPTRRVVKVAIGRLLENTAQQLTGQPVKLLPPAAAGIQVVARPPASAYVPVPRESLARGLSTAAFVPMTSGPLAPVPPSADAPSRDATGHAFAPESERPARLAAMSPGASPGRATTLRRTGRRIHQVLGCAASTAVFAATLVGSALLHANLPSSRRLVARTATDVLARSLMGKVVIEQVTHLGLDGVDLGTVRVSDPEGKPVLRVDGVHLRARVPLVVRGVLRRVGGKMVLPLESFTIDDAEVNLDQEPISQKLRLARSFASRTPPSAPPSTPAAPTRIRVEVPGVHLAHGWVHGEPSAGTLIDADITHVDGRAVYDSVDMTEVDTSPLSFEARALPPYDPRGQLEAHLRMPAEGAGKPLSAWGELHGTVGDLPVVVRARMDGDQVEASADAATVTPEQLQRLVPGAPLREAGSLHASARGTLPSLAVEAVIKAGSGLVAIDGAVELAPVVRGDADIKVRDLAPASFSPTAPKGTRVGADLHVAFRVPSSGPEADVDGSTFPLDWAGQRVPGTQLKAHATKLAASGSVLVHEPGIPTEVRFTADIPRGSAVLDVDAKASSLWDAPRLAHAAQGAARVTAHAVVTKAGVWATVNASARDVVAGSARVGSTKVVARIEGPFDGLRLDTQIEAVAASVGANEADVVRITAKGPLLSPHVAVELHDPRWSEFRVESDLAAKGGFALSRVSARYQSGGLTSDVKIARVESRSGQVLVRGIEVTGSGANAKGDLALSPTGVKADFEGTFDLTELTRPLGPNRLTGGTMAVSVHVKSVDRDHRGQIKVSVRGVEQPLIRLVHAGLDATVDLEGSRARAKLEGTLSTIVELPIVTLKSGGEATLDGRLTDGRTWKNMTGEARVDELLVDLDSVFSQQIVEGFLTLRPSLPKLSGKARASARVALKRPGELPEFDAAIATTRLSVELSPHRMPDGEVKAQKFEGLDVSLAVHGRRAGGSGSMDLSTETALSDKHGPWVTLSSRTTLDPKQTIADVSALEGPERAAGQARLERLPLMAKLEMLERPIEEWPADVKPYGMKGRLAGSVELAGSLGAPTVDAKMTGRGLVAVTDSTPWLVDMDTQAHVTESGATFSTVMSEGGDRVLELTASSDVKVRDAIWSTGQPLAWTADAKLKAHEFHLEAIPVLSENGVTGRLNGEATIARLHGDPDIAVDLSVKQGSARGVGFPVATVAAHLSAHEPSVVRVSMQQAPRFEQKTTGALALSASSTLGFRDGLVPFLDSKKVHTAALTMGHFDIAPLAGLASSVIGDLGGVLDGRIELAIKAHEGALSGGDVSLDGGLKWSEGQLVIPQVGQTFKKGEMSITTATRDDKLVVSVRDLSLGAYTGKVRGSADIEIPAGSLLGPPPQAGAKPQDQPATLRASISISEKERIPVTYEGVPLGNASGNIDAELSSGGRGTEVWVAIPHVKFELPDGSKGRNPENLTEDPDLGVIDKPPSKEDAKKAAGSKPTVAHIGIGYTMANLKAGRAASGDLLVERKGMGVRATGLITIDVTDKARASGEIATSGGRVEVLGKVFYVEKGEVNFNGDPSNPYLSVRARWDVPDNSKVFAEVEGNVSKFEVHLRSDPARSESQVVNLILFGREDFNTATDSTGTPNSQNGSGGGAATAASAVLNYLIDPVDVLGHRFQANVDETSSGTLLGVVTEIRPNLWATFDVNVAKQPEMQNADTSSVMLDWRFAKAWSLRTTLGDRGSSVVDMLWRHRF